MTAREPRSRWTPAPRRRTRIAQACRDAGAQPTFFSQRSPPSTSGIAGFDLDRRRRAPFAPRVPEGCCRRHRHLHRSILPDMRQVSPGKPRPAARAPQHGKRGTRSVAPRAVTIRRNQRETAAMPQPSSQCSRSPGSSGLCCSAGLRRADRRFRQGGRRADRFEPRHAASNLGDRAARGARRLALGRVGIRWRDPRPRLGLSRAVRPGNRRVLALLFPRATARRRRTRGAGGQTQSVVLVAIFAVLFLGARPLSWKNWVGIGLVLVGVLLVALKR